VPILINAGIGGVLLWLYVKQSQVVLRLQTELREVRREQWAFIVYLVGQEMAEQISNGQRDDLTPRG